MSSAGIYARIGYEFQDAVATYFATQLLERSEIISMYVEATGIQGSSAKIRVDDIVRCYASGRCVFTQIKSSSPDQKNWTIDSLHTENELKKIIAQLRQRDDDGVELICPHGFGDLEELKKDVNNFADLISFQANATKAAKTRLLRFSSKAEIDESLAFTYIKDRISFGPRHLLDGWIHEAARKFRSKRSLNALQKLIVDHSLRHASAPRYLTVDYIKEMLAPLETDDQGQSIAVAEPTREWRNDSCRREFFLIETARIGALPPGNIDALGQCAAPNLQLSIRPVSKDVDLSVSRLAKKLTSGGIELPLFSPISGGALGRNVVGVARYILRPKISKVSRFHRCLEALGLVGKKDDASELVALTQIYEDGTICFVESISLGGKREDAGRIIPAHIERNFVATLNDARNLLKEFDVDYPYEVKATILGVGNGRLPILNAKGEETGGLSHLSQKSTIEHSASILSESESSLAVLKPLFISLWNSLLIERPEYYDEIATLQIQQKLTSAE